METKSSRIQSLDILRGLIMVLMAIDHVRVYSGVVPGGPDPGVFFTRWITHFCAPGFVFFAGTSAFLYGRKINDARALARYLLTRGLLLIVLELTFIRFTWTFNFNYSEFTLAGVIWMIGWCMVLMAPLVQMRPLVVGILGIAILSLQQIFSLGPNFLPATLDPFWEFIYPGGNEPPLGINILYVIVPWIGVMAAGYGFGLILEMDPERRKHLCWRIGFSAIALFIVGGTIFIIMNPETKGVPFIFRLLNQQKYPASQLYLLMTLGPAIALIPWAEKASGKVSEVLTVFGRVPFFYYILHIPLIHITALGVNLLRDGTAHSDWYNTAPFTWVDEPSRWGLPLLYLVFVIDVAVLYFICRWYAEYKGKHPEMGWMKYV